MRLLFIICIFFTLPVFADTTTILDCIDSFADGSSQQGGGNYFIKVENDELAVWYQPYQGQDDVSEEFICNLEKIKTSTSSIKLYTCSYPYTGSDKDETTEFEYASIGTMGVLDVRWNGEWFETNTCEISPIIN